MKEIRCTQCSELLLKASEEYGVSSANIKWDIKIQCTRSNCKTINHYKAKRTIEEQIRRVISRGEAQGRAVSRKSTDSKGMPR